jgi:hypothetical protein
VGDTNAFFSGLCKRTSPTHRMENTHTHMQRSTQSSQGVTNICIYMHAYIHTSSIQTYYIPAHTPKAAPFPSPKNPIQLINVLFFPRRTSIQLSEKALIRPPRRMSFPEQPFKTSTPPCFSRLGPATRSLRQVLRTMEARYLKRGHQGSRVHP